MSFDTYTVALLIRPENAPTYSDEVAEQVQDQHLNHLATLASTGALLAAGPFRDQDDPSVRGIAIMAMNLEESRGFLNADPTVRAGVIEYRLQRWLVPSGAVSFGKADFPRTAAEATARLSG